MIEEGFFILGIHVIPQLEYLFEQKHAGAPGFNACGFATASLLTPFVSCKDRRTPNVGEEGNASFLAPSWVVPL